MENEEGWTSGWSARVSARAPEESSDFLERPIVPRSSRGSFLKLARFFIGSLIGLGIDLGLFGVLVFCGGPGWAANLVSSGVAVCIIYLLSTRYVFGNAVNLFGVATFFAWYALSIAGFSALIYGLETAAAVSPILAKVMILPISFGANFLSSRYIFHKWQGQPTDAAR